jgi:hypothetical protein
MEVRASQAHYTVSTDHDEPVTPADFAKAMMLKAAQLEEEAQRKEGEAASILEAARSLRETARDLRAKAQVLLTDTEHAQE